jgi:hypothetical protein
MEWLNPGKIGIRPECKFRAEAKGIRPWWTDFGESTNPDGFGRFERDLEAFNTEVSCHERSLNLWVYELIRTSLR